MGNPNSIPQTEATAAADWFDRLPDTGFIRQRELLGDRNRGVPGVVPISSATLWRRVADGSFPRPLKLGPRTTAWKVADVRCWLKAQQR